ncbi:hypothetical protein L207DRAFT_174631 [Hyaloscypha variabilis F]|uniref:Uncharacterized protein n=1 Tax=Hyaloscypha variabilis (strain UAMH 11265 / GT02V1 / F) TaxID=1149755 RepID=A0A2J6R3F7_HYAVF|nr:hypothetical protein L207DRAFT_174631 [Hyaloscypha variabilis F]
MMVEATDFEMKKLQPYYLMARKEGASAEESVLIDPLSLWTYFTNPIHWAPDLCLRNHDFTRYPNCTYITKRFTWHHPRRAIEATSCSQQYQAFRQHHEELLE